MMNAIFTTLSRAVEGTPLIALAAAFIWGILSVLLSPCHLSSIPLIVGFIDGQGRMTTRRAFGLSLLFSVGILITIGIIGAITGAAGRRTPASFPRGWGPSSCTECTWSPRDPAGVAGE